MDMISTVFLLVSIFIFACIFYGPWQSLCIAWARQSMFEARDEIFDAAASGLISFDSDQYKTLRRAIERMIRFCDEISWPRLMLLFIANRSEDSTQIRDTIEGLPSDRARETANHAMRKVAHAILLCLACRSIILVFFFFIARCAKYVNDGLLMTVYHLVDRDAECFDHYAVPHKAKAA